MRGKDYEYEGEIGEFGKKFVYGSAIDRAMFAPRRRASWSAAVSQKAVLSPLVKSIASAMARFTGRARGEAPA